MNRSVALLLVVALSVLIVNKGYSMESTKNWKILQGEMSGKPIFVRIDAGWDTVSQAKYSYRMGIAIPLKKPKSSGLPTNEEMNALNSIEDLIDQELTRKDITVLTIIITTNSMREFVLYTNDPNGAQNKFSAIKNKVKTHELQMITEKDPGWEVYKSYLK